MLYEMNVSDQERQEHQKNTGNEAEDGAAQVSNDDQSLNSDETSEPENENTISSGEPLPMEHAMISLIGPSMEETSWRLQSVNEAQVTLASTLSQLEERLKNFIRETHPHDIQPTISKISTLKKRLMNLNYRLGNVEASLFKTSNHVKDSELRD